jgi:murein DD-endopeptidase MepM/ murein hydrolase activator NlpD
MLTPTVARQLRKAGFEASKKALEKFQAAKGLAPTGVVNPRTAQALKNVAEVATRNAQRPKDVFITGMKNDKVAAMEKNLAKLGFKVGARDGVLDEKLMDAVVAFKKRHPELRNVGRWAGSLVRGAIADAVGPKSAKETPSGLFYPAGKVGSIIGRPFQGTHSLGNWQSDNALDIGLPVGTPIYATSDGVIGPRIGPLTSSSSSRFAGQRLTLEANNGNEFYYAHLSTLKVRAGQHVRKGQLLGFSGSANGVGHLHIGVKNGDPQRLFGV